MSNLNFDPNSLGLDNGNLYGLPMNINTSECVVYSVPWDVTVSYQDGTSYAPALIQQESLQVDLYDLDYENFWQKGIYFVPPSVSIAQKSQAHRPLAIEVLKLMAKGETIETNHTIASNVQAINDACTWMVNEVYQHTLNLLNMGKKVALLGGDHSTPLGYIRALGDKYQSFGILQIDAHMDLREAYEYFEYSHASIIYNALKLECVSSVCQVGIRDFCEDELALIKESQKPINTFYDRRLQRRKIDGESWKTICEEIVSKLPEYIYLSFDIDGLNPALCPNTGTPVPGGLELEEVFYLLHAVKASNKHIIGLDLNEVGNAVWDANVGARTLYRLIGWWLS